MTRWPRRARPRVEPPEWVRVFHPEDWAEPDEHELLMVGDPLPGEIREWHARRRWCTAANDWYRANPDAVDEWLDDLLDRRRRRLGKPPSAPSRSHPGRPP